MSQRIEKVQKLAREVLGDEIGRLKDPRIGFVTVTDVRVTSDLSYAKVYVTILGEEEERSKSLEGLRSSATHLRSVLGKQIHVRRVPELQFIEDDLQDKALRVEELIHQIHETDEERS